MRSRSGGSARMSGPSGRRSRSSSSTGPFQSTASCSAPRSTSQGSPVRGVPRGWTRQRPVIRRWLRRTCPPAKRSSRFLPSASTDSSTRPSIRSAIRLTAARGCGVSTSTDRPTRTCSRAAAACRMSPSGTTPAYDSVVTRRFIGVRWWLGAAFAVVAATSTAIVVSQFSDRSENTFRAHAEQLALTDVRRAARTATPENLPRLANQLDVKLRLYRAPNAAPPLEREAVRAALTSGEYARGSSNGKVFIAAVPLHGMALVAVSVRPDVAAAIGTINGEALRAGVIAGVVGVVVGLLLAQLIALRLRRLSLAAEALAHGDFETPLRFRFRDEFGALTYNFERMR